MIWTIKQNCHKKSLTKKTVIKSNNSKCCSSIHPLEASGAIMSSAADMTKWLSYLLDAIKRPSDYKMGALRQLFTERVLLPSYFRQAAATATPEPILHIGYAMGFMTSYYKGNSTSAMPWASRRPTIKVIPHRLCHGLHDVLL